MHVWDSCYCRFLSHIQQGTKVERDPVQGKFKAQLWFHPVKPILVTSASLTPHSFALRLVALTQGRELARPPLS